MVELIGGPVWRRNRTIGHYGGAVDKVACDTERTPYCYTWYRAFSQFRGSAYTTETDTLVDVENIALGRLYGGALRTSEKLRCNSIPLTSYERIGYWIELLDVPSTDEDTYQAARQRCAGKYVAAIGPTEAAVDETISKFLGPNYVRTYRWRTGQVEPDYSDVVSYWPENPNASAPDLGGGEWYSNRATLSVESQQLPNQTDDEWLRQRRELLRILDTILGAEAKATVGDKIGFILAPAENAGRLSYTLLS